jgi:hypothetical protein
LRIATPRPSKDVSSPFGYPKPIAIADERRKEENMTDAPQPSLEVARDLLIILAGAIVDLKEAVRQLGGEQPDVARSIGEVDAQITQFIEALDGWPGTPHQNHSASQ